MTKTEGAAARKTLSVRTGASTALLKRKAQEKAADAVMPVGMALEDNFPLAGGKGQEAADKPLEPAVPALASEPTETPAQSLAAKPDPQCAAAPAAWSEADESAFQAMTARRKAAGFQRRGRDVGGQVLRVGDIAPNPNTVVAVLVGLVPPSGEIARNALLRAMAGATFPHPRAKPQDASWRQGYIAGAIRDGFLAVVAASPAAALSVSGR